MEIKSPKYVICNITNLFESQFVFGTDRSDVNVRVVCRLTDGGFAPAGRILRYFIAKIRDSGLFGQHQSQVIAFVALKSALFIAADDWRTSRIGRSLSVSKSK